MCEARLASPPPSLPTTTTLTRARRLLYVSHLFAQFTDVSWQFCLVLFLAAFTHYESLVLVCTYNLWVGVCVFLGGGVAGRFVDSYNRWRVAQTLVVSQNVTVLIATLACYGLLTWSTEPEQEEERLRRGGIPTDVPSLLLLLLIHVFGALAEILASGFTVAMERDWVVKMASLVVVVAEGPTRNGQRRTGNNDHEKRDKDDAIAARSQWLSETNVAMRQIDLSCKGLAPAAAGFFVAAFDSTPDEQEKGSDLRAAALLVGGLNMASLLVEYLCTRRIYTMVPALAEPLATPVSAKTNHGAVTTADLEKPTTENGDCDKDSTRDAERGANTTTTTKANQRNDIKYGSLPQADNDHDDDDDDDGTANGEHKNRLEGANINDNTAVDGTTDSEETPSGTCWLQKCWIMKTCTLYRDMQIYMRQSFSWAGIALALLYLNVLTFGAIMTAYLIWRHMSLQTIGVWRGVASAVGLLGTVVYKGSIQRMTIVQTGMWSVAFQFLCVTVSYISLFLQSDRYRLLSLAMLIGGVCISRVGLWVFDMSVTQLMQEHVQEGVRGVVGGIQQSLHALFGLLTFVLGIWLDDPRDFQWLVVAGYVSVGVSMLCFFFGVFQRGQSFHLALENAHGET